MLRKTSPVLRINISLHVSQVILLAFFLILNSFEISMLQVLYRTLKLCQPDLLDKSSSYFLFEVPFQTSTQLFNILNLLWASYSIF